MKTSSIDIGVEVTATGFKFNGGTAESTLEVKGGAVTMEGGAGAPENVLGPTADGQLALTSQIGPQRRPARIMPKYHYDLATGWSDWYGNGTTAHDTSDKIDGAGSIKIITAAGGSLQFCGMRNNITDVSMAGHTFRIFVKASNWSTVSEAKIIISTSGTFTSRYDFDVKSWLVNPPNNEWIEVTFTKSDLVVGAGTPDLATANDIILRVADTGTATTVWFDGLSVVPVNRTKGIVSIVFDEGYDSQYSVAKPYIEKYGFRSTFFANYDTVGDSGYMTQANLNELHRVGHEIGATSTSDLTGLPLTNLVTELDLVKNYQSLNGFSQSYAYPAGSVNDQVRTEIMKRFTSGRGLYGTEQNIDYVAPYFVNAYRPTNATSTATLTGIIDKAIADKTWAIIVFRKIVTSPASANEYSTANFNTVIDYLNTSGVVVLPMEQVLNLGAAY